MFRIVKRGGGEVKKRISSIIRCPKCCEGMCASKDLAWFVLYGLEEALKESYWLLVIAIWLFGGQC